MVTLARDKIIVEIDSLVVVKLVNEGCTSLHLYASLVNQIRVMMYEE